MDAPNQPATTARGIGRRRFLGLLAGGAAVLGGAGLLWRLVLPAPLDAGELTLLRQVIDHLVPRDDVPGALDLGVDQGVAETLNTTRQFRRLARRGLAWLDDAAGSRDDWDGAFRAALEQPRDAPARQFFLFLRDETFGRYYADPRAWVGLNISHPPQPLGYLDYQAAPATTIGQS